MAAILSLFVLLIPWCCINLTKLGSVPECFLEWAALMEFSDVFEIFWSCLNCYVLCIPRKPFGWFQSTSFHSPVRVRTFESALSSELSQFTDSSESGIKT